MKNIENLPFELHLTVDAIHNERETEFATICQNLHSKAILIHLARGAHQQQPMLTKVFYENGLETVVNKANLLASELKQLNFNPNRIKIEIPAYCAHLFENELNNVKNYFEWHAKIEYKQVELLTQICQQHQTHLSKNSLKNDENQRFITLRHYGNQPDFEQRIANLKAELTQNTWTIGKEQAEFCLYDSNVDLDKGWL